MSAVLEEGGVGAVDLYTRRRKKLMWEMDATRGSINPMINNLRDCKSMAELVFLDATERGISPVILYVNVAIDTTAIGFKRRWFGSALNIKTLAAAVERRETPIKAPPSESQDKISFIINNLSIANIDPKAKEFTKVLKEEYYPWFVQYMVMKRFK
uniref:CCR4-Not transcription complex subunit 1 isoform X1 n=1 Tax=Tanacetum cinerariifolium TaxID=118510 RepID=A0A699I9Y6_TANCI|nr:CCR4-Not transcription complex subunit 1 isoform X1 [Tanacetum cinerariifolium]GEZ26715.1 CCR4-Not transcription complex subunit 1 isoform X1 [Tanacetum cinerariifolium]